MSPGSCHGCGLVWICFASLVTRNGRIFMKTFILRRNVTENIWKGQDWYHIFKGWKLVLFHPGILFPPSLLPPSLLPPLLKFHFGYGQLEDQKSDKCFSLSTWKSAHPIGISYALFRYLRWVIILDVTERHKRY